MPFDANAADVTVGVVGTGSMGRGIMQVSAQGGMRVIAFDEKPGAAQAARDYIAKMLGGQVEKGRLQQSEATAALDRIVVAKDLAEVGKANVIIEAIIERLDAKQALFAKLEAVTGPDTIIASNTSSIPITAIASACKSPERVGGMHFFNPVPLMRLVEVIPGLKTAPWVTDAMMTVGRRMTREPVLCTDSPAFLVNHVGRAFVPEAQRLLTENIAGAADIDRILTGAAGFKLGPFALADMVGIDIQHGVMESVYGLFYGEPMFAPFPISAQRVQAGLLGQKTGAGWYRYDGGKKVEPAFAPVPSARPKSVWVHPSVHHPELMEPLIDVLTRAGANLETGEKASAEALVIIAPIGWDLTTACYDLKLDASRTVAVDVLFGMKGPRTLMVTPATDPKMRDAAHGLLAADGQNVIVINDSPGFVAQRVVAMIVNIACGVAQRAIATPADIDKGTKLGLGYPYGPLEWGDRIGAGRVLFVLQRLQAFYGEPRYRPNAWLKRRVMLGLPLSAPEGRERELKTVHSDDPVKCAEAVIDRVGRDIRLAVPIGIGKPNRLVNALYRIAEADRRVALKIFTGISLARPTYRASLEKRFAEPLLDRLFPSYPELLYVEAQRQRRLPANVEVREFFLQAGAWLSNTTVQQSYTSLNYSHVAGHLMRAGTNAFAQLVAPNQGDTARFSLSSNTDVTLDIAPYVTRRRADGQPVAFAAEVNSQLPYMPGEAEIDRGQFDVLLEAGPGYDLFAPPKEPVSLSDYATALHAATLIADGGTLQIGIGSFSDALAHALILRHRQNAEFRGLIARLGTPLHGQAQLEPFAEGLYGCTEMLVDGFLALKRAGVLKRRVAMEDGHEAILHAGFFVGNQAFYRELKEMPRAELDEIRMTAISFTNTLHGDGALKRRHRPHARFVNTAMVATLLGAVSSDQLEDGRVVSGPGGQHDLVSMAHELEGARSMIAVRGTRRQDRRTISNIVWRYANATLPRALRDIIVTEYGIADLKGKSDRDCIAEMLGVADSAFQGAMIRDAQRAGKLEPGFAVAPHADANSARRIEEALGPARRDGLLPVFPLGSEMTAVEQALVGPLQMLKSADYLNMAQAACAGISGGGPSASERAALERLQLERPAGIGDWAYRLLVLGAMRVR